MRQPDDGLPTGWELVDVASVGEVRLGRQRSPDKQTGRYFAKYIRAANITPDGLDLTEVLEMDFSPAEREVFALITGDVVLAEASGSPTQVGRAAIWREEIPGCCYQNTVIRFRPHAVSSEYALLVFRHYVVSGVFAQVARGVGIQHLGATRLAEMSFPLPPIAEQARIAVAVERRGSEIRNAQSALRSALARIAEQNKEIIAAAVRGELVKGEAVNAKELEVAGPAYPKGWAVARADEAGEITLGKQREPRRHRGPHMRPYLRVANVYEDRIDATDVLEMNFSDEEFDTYALRYGDILLNEGQSPELVGRPAMYRDEVPGACFQNTLLRFRVGPLLESEFVLLVFRHYLHSGEFRRRARWTTNIAHLSRQRFASMPIPIPPLDEQRRIVEDAKRRLNMSSAQEADARSALDALPRMEAELLAAAVSGALGTQDPNDEPASALLARLGPVPARSTKRVAMVQLPTESSMIVPREIDRKISGPSTPLAEVIRAAGRPLQVPELFAMAGYDKDSTEHVERFYLALRTELGHSLQQVGEAIENAVLEVVVDASS